MSTLTAVEAKPGWLIKNHVIFSRASFVCGDCIKYNERRKVMFNSLNVLASNPVGTSKCQWCRTFNLFVERALDGTKNYVGKDK